MATKQKFGSAHTAEKLRKLEEYLRAYSTALKNQGFHLIFFDAFAGTGDVQIGDDGTLLEGVDDYSPFIQGSTQRALQLGASFDEYVFVEKSRTKAKVLEGLKTTYPALGNRILIHRADANEALLKFCTDTNWAKCRAVVFLDPYGNQVKWRTIEAPKPTPSISGICFLQA
jgi:three-Cys-motif partner protein